MSVRINVVIEKDEGGWFAYCPDLPGCQTQADTFGDVMANIQEAAELYLDSLTRKERKALARKQVFTTTLEVSSA